MLTPQGLREQLSSCLGAPAWWLGLSGGLDSMVLLELLAQARQSSDIPPLYAVHIHHGLHPEADAWAMHCQRACDARGVPLTVVRVRVGQSPSIEQAARDARYAAFAEALPEGAEVALTYSGDDPRLVVSAGRSRFNLPVLPAGDFPVMSTEAGGSRYSLAKEDLIRLIDKTRFAVSTEETRYYLNGLYLHVVAEQGVPLLRAVATDGHRLALAEMPAPDGAAGAPGVIVPRKTVDQVRRLLDDGAGPVEVQVSAQKIRFQLGEASLTSKVIDGAFPDYMRVIPKGNDKQADIDRADFAAAVDRVATISAEKSRSVKLAFELDRVTLTVRNMEAGQGVEEVEIGYSEEPFEIGFNARYLLDVCGQITGETAAFKFADPASPTLVLDPGDPGVQYVLMPLRV